MKNLLTNHYLLPGSLFCNKQPHLVTTVLGSCVTVCLWDKVKLWGGMNHYLLPENREGQVPSLKFGDNAIDFLVKSLETMGSSRYNLQAKIFGGARVLSGMESFLIGEKNVEVAKKRLRALGITIVNEHTGGECGRMIRFNTKTGIVQLRRNALSTLKTLHKGISDLPY